MMNRLEKLKPLALLVLRIGVGVIFIYHGYPKLFRTTQQMLDGFASLGFPSWAVYVAGAVELFGGGLLILGLFTRVAGVLLAGQMAIAVWTAHMGKGILAVSEYQFPLVLALASFTLATTGAGLISLDYAIYRDKS
jgi:putative oxidoreductase